MDATLDGVTLSPLSIQVDYTVHQELVWSENRESGRENEYDREQSYRYFESLPVVITYTDGTTQDLTNAGGGITPGDGETVCQKSRIFDEMCIRDRAERAAELARLLRADGAVYFCHWGCKQKMCIRDRCTRCTCWGAPAPRAPTWWGRR